MPDSHFYTHIFINTVKDENKLKLHYMYQEVLLCCGTFFSFKMKTVDGRGDKLDNVTHSYGLLVCRLLTPICNALKLLVGTGIILYLAIIIYCYYNNCLAAF